MNFVRQIILKRFNFLRHFCYVQSSEDFPRFNFLRKTFHASEFCAIFSETFQKSSFKILLFFAFTFQMLLNFCPLCNFLFDKNRTLKFKKKSEKSRVEVDRNSETIQRNQYLRNFGRRFPPTFLPLCSVAFN